MKLVVRVDFSTQIGLGHLMRCLTLAEEISHLFDETIFVCRRHEAGQEKLFNTCVANYAFDPVLQQIGSLKGSEKFVNENVGYIGWLGDFPEEDAKITLEFVGLDDWVIVDHYGIDSQWHKLVKEKCYHLMVIDDLCNRNYLCDILLDQTYNRENFEYSGLVSSDCRVLTGSQYALLRKEFQILRGEMEKKRPQSTILQRLLVFMGGKDSKNIAGSVLAELIKKGWHKALDITVVVPIRKNFVSELAAIEKSENKITILEKVDNMAELMAQSDLAIGSGGTASWERCCLGLPSLVFVYADNQLKTIRSLAEKGAVIPWSNAQELNEAIELILNNPKLYQEMVKFSFEVCDGKGTKRIREELINFD